MIIVVMMLMMNRVSARRCTVNNIEDGRVLARAARMGKVMSNQT